MAAAAVDSQRPLPAQQLHTPMDPFRPNTTDRYWPQDEDPPHSDSDSPPLPQDPIMTAHITSLRLLFTAWLTHFRTLGYIKETTMDHLDKTVLRKILTLSVRDAPARVALGTSLPVWTDMLELLRVAVPSLESRSYGTIPAEYGTAPDGTQFPNGAVYDAPAANVIVSHYATLFRDLQRLNNILCITRNILTAGTQVQNLAAKLAVDREVCCLINLCVKTTARGYDGDGPVGDEDKWQAVVNEYKKLLITCLQFLSNLVTLNERLKLMLWVELFDGSSEGNVPGWHDPAGAVRPGYGGKSTVGEEPGSEDAWVASATGRLLSGRDSTFEEGRKNGTSPFVEESDLEQEEAQNEPGSAETIVAGDTNGDTHLQTGTPPRSTSRTSVRRKSSSSQPQKKTARPPTVYLLWLYEQKELIREELWQENGGVEPTMRNVLARATTKWEKLSEAKKAEFQLSRVNQLDRWHRELRTWKRDVKSWMATHGIDFDVGGDGPQHAEAQDKLGNLLSKMADEADAGDGSDVLPQLDPATRGEASHVVSRLFEPEGVPAHPSRGTMETAEDGIRKLEEGKAGLLKRLEDNAALGGPGQLRGGHSPQDGDAVSPSSPVESPDPDTPLPLLPPEHSFDEADEEFDPEEEEEEDPELDSDEVDDDENSEEDDYDRIPGEEGRGLLTDVPLILGPNEIEVLPMIIMSGIVTDQNQVKQKQTDSTNDQLQVFLNMYTIRCHLLLAQENGRNLLRELLIFVAAWDLREEELYFKFMVKIVETILLHGLMPFAYSAFKESKDIISPAQAVIMKLLTKIFHARGAFIPKTESVHTPGAPLHPATGWRDEAIIVNSRDQNLSGRPKEGGDVRRRSSSSSQSDAAPHPSSPNPPFSLSNSDPTRTIVSTLFSEFRTNIIPQICALIFLQGQIRAGHASIEDFPLNLWDMERMYEGVYQYLEFFAILTDHDKWKEDMAEWEVVSELVTLLRELEFGIGKDSRRRSSAISRSANMKRDGMNFESEEDYQEHLKLVDNLKHQSDKAEIEKAKDRGETKFTPPDWMTNPQERANIIVEAKRSGMDTSAASETPPSKTPVAVERPYSPLPPPPSNQPGQTSPPSTHTTSSSATPPPPSAANPHEEPADFEWRNLKKLCVLVLSSLVWRNKPLQDQVLRFGGVETLLRCCVQDEHNPFIREHSIMCLRFLVEGNADIRKRVEEVDAEKKILEARAAEDRRAVEAWMRGERNRVPEYTEPDAGPEPESGDEMEGEGEECAPDDKTTFHDGHVLGSIIVPPEVLDPVNYETFMDQRGQVGLRRKEVGRGVPGSVAERVSRRKRFGPFFDRRPYVAVGRGVEGVEGAGLQEYDVAEDDMGDEQELDDEEEEEAEAGPEVDIPEALRPGRRQDAPSTTPSQHSAQQQPLQQPSYLPPSQKPLPQEPATHHQPLQPHPNGSLQAQDQTQNKGKGKGKARAPNGNAQSPSQSQTQTHSSSEKIEPRPRTAADLPDWVERVTWDLPHKRAARAERAAAERSKAEEERSKQQERLKQEERSMISERSVPARPENQLAKEKEATTPEEQRATREAESEKNHWAWEAVPRTPAEREAEREEGARDAEGEAFLKEREGWTEEERARENEEVQRGAAEAMRRLAVVEEERSRERKEEKKR